MQPNRAAVRCLTFDLDDTLWELGPVIRRAEQALQSWLAENCPRIAAGNSTDDLREHRRVVMENNPHLHHDVTALRRLVLGRLMVEFDYPETLVDAALTVFREYRNKVVLFDDVLPLLERLRERYTLGVITNGNADLDVIGIGGYFDFIVYAGETGCAKPDRRIFEAALDSAGAAAHETVHVGDEPGTDMLGAAQLGIGTVWVNATRRPWPGGLTPDAVVRSISELEAALERWG